MTQQGDYRINYEPLFGPLQLIDVREAIKRADHPWYNQTLIEVGGVLLRLVLQSGFVTCRVGGRGCPQRRLDGG